MNTSSRTAESTFWSNMVAASHILGMSKNFRKKPLKKTTKLNPSGNSRAAESSPHLLLIYQL